MGDDGILTESGLSPQGVGRNRSTPSNIMKSQDLVVCNSLGLSKNTETTFEFSAKNKTKFQIKQTLIYIEREREEAYILAISDAWSSSSMAAKPFMCLVYE